MEAKIARLRERLNHAVVVERPGGDLVAFGSVVGVVDELTGAEKTYTLVGALDAKPGEGRLSIESPFAQALRGRREGDVATVKTPRGDRRWRVVSVG
jgi:transcription elongation factor GreA